MFDETQWDDDELRLGVRQEGQRIPSEILEAILPDLVWYEQHQVEAGHDWLSIAHITVMARALLALLMAEPELDVEFEDEDAVTDEGPDALVIAEHIHRLIEYLDDATPMYARYGWASDDVDDDGFCLLGVFPHWDGINTAIEEDRLLVIDGREDLYESHKEMHEAGYPHAILEEETEDGVQTVMFRTLHAEEIWRW